MSYTKGPWFTRYSIDNPHVVSIVNSALTNFPVANVYGSISENEYQDAEVTIATAQLISAAPDLLEALEELHDLMEDVISGEYEPDSFTLQPARAAIAKAKGEL